MKIVRSSWFPPKGYKAIMLVWWLIIRNGYQVTSRLINHEEIHCEQQKEMLILPFFIWYGLEFIFRFCQYHKWNMAYRNISFEREAYAKQYDIAYLGKRKRFAWLNYINMKRYEN